MTDEDDYVEQATLIDVSKAPSGTRLDGSETRREHYRRLAVANSEDWVGTWRNQKRATVKDRGAVLDAIASSLELTDLQHERARHILDSLPETFYRAYANRLLALCSCGIAGAEDGRSYHPNHIHPNVDNESHFSALAKDLGVEYSEVYRCWERIQWVTDE